MRRARALGLAVAVLLLQLAVRGCEPEVTAVELDLEELRARRLPLERLPCDVPPSERLGIPDELLARDYPVYRTRPVPATLVRELRQAIERLPAPLGRAFERHVCRVVLVTGLTVGGTLSMLKRDPSRGALVLNLDYLGLSADAWMASKEASFFAQEPGLSIETHMAPEQDRQALLEFLLSHELGHVLHSAFDSDPEIERFLSISWPRHDLYWALPLLPYAELRGELPRSAFLAEPLYEVVAASSFPSLTAAMNPNEDFADSLATYAHDVLSGRPWRVDVWRDGQLVWRLGSCWNELRCQQKRTSLEAFLARFMP